MTCCIISNAYPSLTQYAFVSIHNLNSSEILPLSFYCSVAWILYITYTTQMRYLQLDTLIFTVEGVGSEDFVDTCYKCLFDRKFLLWSSANLSASISTCVGYIHFTAPISDPFYVALAFNQLIIIQIITYTKCRTVLIISKLEKGIFSQQGRLAKRGARVKISTEFSGFFFLGFNWCVLFYGKGFLLVFGAAAESSGAQMKKHVEESAPGGSVKPGAGHQWPAIPNIYYIIPISKQQQEKLWKKR